MERYINGLFLSVNKTLQGIHSQYVWPDESAAVKRRAMHAGVFEAPWNKEDLMARQRM
ncbi:MAG: hypothetical protein ACFB0E_03725 [Leptolyngbyaceae cyanobacterium]